MKPVLITLTGPTASGKSFLLDHIRKTQVFDVLTSATTRKKRANERDGIDYHFLSQQQFDNDLAAGKFIEHAVYDGHYYGVTRDEFTKKLVEDNIVVIILEPFAIKKYARLAKQLNAEVLSYYVHADFEIRRSRFFDRVRRDIESNENKADTAINYLNRYEKMLTEETKWFTLANWKRTLMGTYEPAINVNIILGDISKLV